ncbi:MAG: 4'-phosphopantetheinyl transferase superfamily protein [Oscillospiraceae bacterium]|nr:4'-phosphopantetheinyl transferase superfamily protein [Oscillospiraceae bacterium]
MQIYYLNTDLLRDNALFDRLLAQCSTQRAARIREIRSERERRNRLAASCLLDVALRTRQTREKDAVYVYSDAGKPEIPALQDFYFSISHSGSTAVLAVSDVPVGVDVQKPDPIPDKLLRRYFTPRETASAKSGRLWTLKESYGKLTGEGVAVLERTELSFDEEIRILRDGIVQPVCFREFRLENGCFLATCFHENPSLSIEMIEVNRSDLI